MSPTNTRLNKRSSESFTRTQNFLIFSTQVAKKCVVKLHFLAKAPHTGRIPKAY